MNAFFSSCEMFLLYPCNIDNEEKNESTPSYNHICKLGHWQKAWKMYYKFNKMKFKMLIIYRDPKNLEISIEDS